MSRFTKHFLLFATVFLTIVIGTILYIPDKDKLLIDYRAFYTTGTMILNGHSSQLYDLGKQSQQQKKLFPGSQDIFIFFNPPFAAVILSPLAKLTYDQGFLLFAVINSFVFLLSLYLLMKHLVKSTNEKHTTLFFIFILLFVPIHLAILQGQLTFFLFLGLVLSWLSFKNNKPYTAGMWLGLLLLKPHLLLFPILFLLLKKQWKAVAGFLTVAAMMMIISTMGTGAFVLKPYISFLLTVPSLGNTYGLYPQLQPTMLGLIQFVANTNLLNAVLIPYCLGLILSIILFVFTLRGNLQTTKKRFDIQWSILILLMLLTSIHTHYYDLVLLLFPLILLMRSIKRYWLYALVLCFIAFITLLFILKSVLLVPFILGLLLTLYLKLRSALT